MSCPERSPIRTLLGVTGVLFLSLALAAQSVDPDGGGSDDGSTPVDPGNGPTQPPRDSFLGGFRGRPHRPVVLSGVSAMPRPRPTASDEG